MRILSDPTSTAWAELTDENGAVVPDSPRFLIGFWPPSRAAQLDARMERLREQGVRSRAKAEDAGKTLGLEGEALEAHIVEAVRKEAPTTELTSDDHEAWMEMVRWSVRGWSGVNGPDEKPIACKTRTVMLDGMEHVELSPESLWLLKANHILTSVGVKCAAFNRLSEEEKKRFAWLSKS